MAKTSRFHRVGIAALDGVTDSGVAIALDVFRTANALRRRLARTEVFAVGVLSPSRRATRTASGAQLYASETWGELQRCDTIVVPGFWLESPVDADALLKRRDVSELAVRLDQAARDRRTIGAACSGVFITAAAGLLDNKRATTTWWLGPWFRERFPAVILDLEQSLVQQGNLLTAGAVFAMADLALTLVARVCGPKLARQCANVLLLDQHPSQTPYMSLRFLVSDPTLISAERYVREHLADRLEVPRIAKHAGMSARSFARRTKRVLGISPLAFVQQVRLEVASQALATTSLPLEAIAERVGYQDVSTLRRLVVRKTGRSPRDLRRS